MNIARGLLAALLGILACVVLPASVLSVWVVQEVADTSGYVETVAPLAENDTVKQETVDRVSAEIIRQVPEVRPEEKRVDAAVDRVVDGPEFPGVWRTANRVAHQELVKVLDDRSSSDRITIDLQPVAKEAAKGLRKEGLPVADSDIPPIRFTVARGDDLRRAQDGYALAENLGFWLPIAWLVLAALTILVARRRLRALAWLAAGSAVMVALALVALRTVRSAVLDEVPTGDRDLIGVLWDVLTRDLSTSYVVIAVAGLVATVALAIVAGLLGRPPREPVPTS
ncbi:hypothetical protein [Nocardioides speluncae]|uniref:hypothetical protein n=1 Tax=Nocardioides speluncae TaxID=2670337 RepID=UPI000D685CF6|nr:hypothetical protein [Nocardioides speluncae]